MTRNQHLKSAPTGLESAGKGATPRTAAKDTVSTENPWTTKKQIARERNATEAEVEVLVAKGYLIPIRFREGGYYRKSQRVYWLYWRDDVEAGIHAYRHGLPPPTPTYKPAVSPKHPWEV